MPTILVVDDDEMFRDIYEDILEDEGYDLIMAENGRLGVDAAIAHMPNLIVMDMNMPEMTGFEAMKLISTNAATSKIPILAVTSENATVIHEEIYESGGSAYLSKPIDAERLVERINDLLA